MPTDTHKPLLPADKIAAVDSRPETYEHIENVRGLMLLVTMDLSKRAHAHDKSKLVSPEVEVFDQFTSILQDLTYGSEEYTANLLAMKPALDHHYAVNDHHPEHFENGMDDMSLIQLTELVCDWYAATRRMNDGNIIRAIEINAERFGYGTEITRLLKNTIEHLQRLERQHLPK